MDRSGDAYRTVPSVGGALIMALLVVCYGIAPAAAQPSTSWRDYHFIALDEMDLEAHNNLPGNYAVLNPGGDLAVLNGAVQLSGPSTRYIVADTITMEANASVVDVYYKSGLHLAATSEIRGTTHPGQPFPLVLSDLPAIPPAVFDSCTLSASDRDVRIGTSRTLAPACYGALVAREGSTITLAPGVYNFRRWDIRDLVTITAQGPTTIYVRENVRTGRHTSIQPTSRDPADLSFFVGADGDQRSTLGGFNLFVGTFVDTNDAELNLRKQTVVIGTVAAIKVKLRVIHEDRLPACGDETVDPAETCDPPGAILPPSNMCRDDCTFCGDGTTQSSEECDDGNQVDNDGCTNACTLPTCGDGITQAGEGCDDGNPVDNDTCTNACTLPTCGNGLTQAGEGCDDGNQVDNDGCTNACTLPTCGDGITQAGEGCDDGNQVDNDGCTNACTLPTCGDGLTQAGEGCDDGNQVDSDGCTNACALPTCGDGINQAGEACDDGNPVDNDGCTNACTLPTCGDGIAQAGEACDDGNPFDNDGCTNGCALPACGDGIPQSGEQCDDGNRVITDGCTNACRLPICGNGVVQSGEQCDDGNRVITDGCTNACRLPICGNGVVQSGEQCDDGNRVTDDGCTNECLVPIVPPTCDVPGGIFAGVPIDDPGAPGYTIVFFEDGSLAIISEGSGGGGGPGPTLIDNSWNTLRIGDATFYTGVIVAEIPFVARFTIELGGVCLSDVLSPPPQGLETALFAILRQTVLVAGTPTTTETRLVLVEVGRV